LENYQKIYSLVDEDSILNKMIADEAKMNIVANQRLLQVQQAIGLRPKD